MRTKSTMRNHATLLALGALLLLLCAPAAEAGTESIIARGFKPNIAYQVNEFDAVNTFNGNLLVNIPLGPTYKTNGTLSYSFGLRYTAEFWNYINYYGINQPGNDPTHITIIDGDGGWNMYSTTVIELGPGGPTGGGDNFIGAEAVPAGMVGPGWMVSNDAFNQVVHNEYYRGGVYTDASGASHVLTPNMHTPVDCGTAGCNNTVAYSHDGSYLRLRLVNNDPLVREIDLPDGTVKRFRCVANCNNFAAEWQLQWTADQYGNVLLVEFVDGNGNPVTGRPQPGQWIWNYTEGTLPDGETRSNPYYQGTPGDRAALKITRRHRLTFSVEDPNGKFAQYPWLLGVRLVRAELAGPHGDRSMLFTFNYAPRQILRPMVLPYILEPSRLLFPYTADKRINVMMLDSITLADGSGKWQFDYYNGGGGDGEDEGMTYTFCGDYTAPSGQCPPAQQYPTSRIAGRVKSVRAPAGGGYSYEYGSRHFPKRPCFAQPRSATAYGGGSMISLRKRQQLDLEGNAVPGAVWQYAGNGYFRTFIDADHDGWDDSDTDHSGGWNTGDALICRAPVEFLASTLDPNGQLTLNYYNLKFGDEWYGAPFSPEEDRADTLTRRDGTIARRFLSSQTYHATDPIFRTDLAAAVRRMFPAYQRNDPPTTATLLRSTYATYDKSASSCDPTINDCEFLNLRMTSEHTRFHDDNGTTVVSGPDGNVTEGAYIETIYGDFDGLGNFRQKNTYGNLKVVGRGNATASDWDHRMEYTLYNPNVTWNQGQANPQGLPDRWILNTYTHTSTMEPGWLVSVRSHFDSNRGYLRARRKIEENGTNAAIPRPPSSGRDLVATTGPDDLLAVFTRRGGTDDNGDPVVVLREENYGGDDGNLEGWQITNDQPSIPLAARRDYTIDTTFKAGGIAKKEYLSCDTTRAYLLESSSVIEKGMGLPTSTTDSSGLTTDYAYDTRGRVINATPPGGLAPETYSYKSKTGTGAINSLTISRETASVTYVYDGLGRVLSEARETPAGTSTKAFSYTATGKVFKEFLPFGNRGYIEHEYDVFDRETKVTGADNKFVDIGYNGIRSAVRTMHGLSLEPGEGTTGQSFQGFDSFGRLWIANDDATRAVYEFDAGSNLIHVILNPAGVSGTLQHRRFHYDGRGALITMTHPELRQADSDVTVVVKNQIDARGHVVASDSLWQGGNPYSLNHRRIRFDYDPAERLLEVWQPAGAAGRKTFKSFEYYPSNDSPGRRARLKTAVRHNYFPDPSRTGGLPTINVTTTRSYSACTGNITTCTGQLSSVNTVVSAPSASGGPAQSFFGGTIGYQYDPRGEVSRIDYPAGNGAPSRSINYGYSKGYLTTVKDGNSRRATLTYALNGLIKHVQLAAPNVADTITPDGSGIMRPGKIDWSWSNGSNSTGDYTYDGAGNISAMGGDTFRYDRALRLKIANVAGQQQKYAYDGFGNITTAGGQAFNVDWKSNRLRAPYAYDDGGNLSLMPDPSGGNLTFVFDAINMMTSVDGQRLGRAFVYDASDERVGVINYKATGGRRELWSLRDQKFRVLRDFERTFNASGTAVVTWKKDYVYRGDVLSNTESPAEGLRDIHADHLGSVRFVTDSNGQLVTTAPGATTSGTRYWPYGSLVFKRGLDERVAFTGHERDDDGTTSDSLDFDNMHARYFSPGLARFMSLDAGGIHPSDPRSWNRYSYLLGNPLIAVDPDGRETQLVVGGYTANNPFGHVGIAINGRIYSFGTDYTNGAAGKRDWGGSLQTYLAAQNNQRQTQVVTLKVTPEQEKALQQHLEANNPYDESAPDYAMLSNSCVTVVENGLDAVGILPNQPGPVTVDRAGNELQAGAPVALTPDALLQQTQEAGVAGEIETVGNEPDISRLESFWNALKSYFR